MKNLKLVTLALVSIFLFSCEGEDGADGTNGENGEGFELLTQFGGFDLTLSGTRIDDIELDAELFEFIYTDFDADQVGEDNSVETIDNITTFRVERQLDPEHGSEAAIEVTRNNETSELEITLIELDDLIVLNSNATFFEIDTTFIEFVSQSVSNFSFDEATQKISFDFELVIDASVQAPELSSNLTVNGSVDAILLQELEVEPTVDPILL